MVGDSESVGSGEDPQERRFDYSRTVAISDGVFAIALTLLVLNIGAPALTPGHQGVLGQRLLDRGDEYFSYAVGFTVIAFLWVRHHRFFRGIDHVDTGLTVLNLAYLGLVAFLPYPTRILGLYADQPASVIMYAVVVSALAIIAGAMRIHAGRAGLLSEAGQRAIGRREHWALVPAVFLLSIPIAFASPRIAVLCWLLVPLLARVGRQISRGKALGGG
jgi:uncharacterized membrane protein